MRSSQDYNFMLKAIMMGDRGVGKSCFSLRLINDEFTPAHLATTHEDFAITTLSRENHNEIKSYPDKAIKLQLWDAPEESFRNITTSHLRGAKLYYIFYDVTDEGSFNRAKELCKLIGKHDVTSVLIGTKRDLNDERVVETARGKALADEFHIRAVPLKQLKINQKS